MSTNQNTKSLNANIEEYKKHINKGQYPKAHETLEVIIGQMEQEGHSKKNQQAQAIVGSLKDIFEKTKTTQTVPNAVIRNFYALAGKNMHKILAA